MKPIIEVENVSKRFFLRGRRAGDLRERFNPMHFSLGKGTVKNTDADLRENTDQVHWAVKDISFEVAPGQTLGIVGHNGSGKSTVLKLLTSIMIPTEGRIHVSGRVGALIEVGAGFHPDLTGRENLFLSGSILGLTRREVAARFDEIVEFANMARFIDMPVKRYSSGMYMRLGFSLVAHVEPEILIIDEVLAVGDALFQRKCLRRLKEFIARGGTVIFVSHVMNHVAEICKTCVWLDRGEVRYIGDTETAVERYTKLVAEREREEFKKSHPADWAAMQAEEEELREAELREAELREAEIRESEEQLESEIEGSAVISLPGEVTDALREEFPFQPGKRSGGRIGSVTLEQDGGDRGEQRFISGQPLQIRIAFESESTMPSPALLVDVFRVSDGLHMFTTSSQNSGVSGESESMEGLLSLPLRGILCLNLGTLVLAEGAYRIRVTLFADTRTEGWFDDPEDVLEEAVIFEVATALHNGGCVYMPAYWELLPSKSAPEISPLSSVMRKVVT